MENTHHDKRRVFESLLRAQQEAALLEIALGGSESRERYGSRVLPFPGGLGVGRNDGDLLAAMTSKPGDVANDEDGAGFSDHGTGMEIPSSFLIVPLEPTIGNIKIRKTPQVVVRYFIGLESNEIATTFQKVLMVDGAQAIQLSMPSRIRIRHRRQQQRVLVPAQANMGVTVQKRGSAGFNGHLIDLSSGGLSFSCPEQHEPLEIGDKVGVSIHGSLLQGTPLSTFGSVCRIARARDEKNPQQASQQYGVQFKLVSVADAMTIDRLVRELGKRSRF
ncbi:MAG: PilZ domain-containing protein [Magnetococcales bacterium]|nr:PilZ domain-containing protein [Magnetococcales bacterium]MBF0149679.1 PilZ domain-containing protein [Magnetococcales bacterium]MBF0173981.1 PilZ domain-containing protein [Magnetococcales bacterium]MBF0346645.1 PilZ domain-containing protein [Magnetococcales bacterium]MBF0630729.1 PilZ domain-containing protein [Magnetococcales bacterium]